MYANGVNQGLTTVGRPNPNVVAHPDPYNPLVRDPQNETSRDQFMRLMIEQLKNQDPMNPLKSQEFTQQLAQLNSLEQLVSINQLLQDQTQSGGLGEATALLGRYVEGVDAGGNFISGYVERVEVIEGQPLLKIGDQLLLVEQVVTVAGAPGAEGGEDG